MSYAGKNFSEEIKERELLFYSKRLNLYVYRDMICFVKYLNDGHELNLDFGSLEI
jgi:hypothetical protein